MAPIKTFVSKFAQTAFTIQSTTSNYPQHHTCQSSSSSSSHITNPVISSTIGSTSLASTPDTDTTHSLSEMCRLFKATPHDNLYLSTLPGGERGVRLYNPVKKGDVILSIPISSCFRDDEPPRWFGEDDGILEDEHDITDYERYNPSAWASRLAASVLDVMELNKDNTISNEDHDALKRGREMWQSFLPDKGMLRASLPVHWSEEVLSSAKCTALELAVDSAYFARANAVMNLRDEMSKVGGNDVTDLELKCHDALDVVQTRACRVERVDNKDGVQWGPPLRCLAPIFDFINHGSSLTMGKASANAAFAIEGEKLCDMDDAKLVVRAIRDVAEGEEVLMDYGESARPAWRCLHSYGFVPHYDPNAEIVDDEQVENVAELWMNGLRFEVDPQAIPFDLVEVAEAQVLMENESLDGEDVDDEDENVGLSPLVAKTIAKRASEAALHLLLVPEVTGSEEESPEFQHSVSLAAALRKSQYKVLESFAENLRGFSSS
eukprot:scaffold1411_cov221-Alexandrium_tamarense.AAC.12